MIEHKTEKLLI